LQQSPLEVSPVLELGPTRSREGREEGAGVQVDCLPEVGVVHSSKEFVAVDADRGGELQPIVVAHEEFVSQQPTHLIESLA
jgi:hypothetical protein